MGAKRIPLSGVELATTQMVHAPISVGDGRDAAGLWVTMAAIPGGSGQKGNRVALSLSIPVGTLIAWLSLPELDELEDQLRQAREDLLASFEPEVGR